MGLDLGYGADIRCVIFAGKTDLIWLADIGAVILLERLDFI